MTASRHPGGKSERVAAVGGTMQGCTRNGPHNEAHRANAEILVRPTLAQPAGNLVAVNTRLGPYAPGDDLTSTLDLQERDNVRRADPVRVESRA